ncbi:tRNA (adenosine(37)-N6)-threonylcarbamoyltransferase complex ATPase subunit type 1 TsaE [Thermogemmatispora sp.]|uniref:tRNA (adenosine(37)-N6)-threonylcarbamoyltransferase complex ATPase subunit type 1 TsaE n=1 Tax=Thermogemmatispora sp. TaxID=1968838 RepID=UPI0035E41030
MTGASQEEVSCTLDVISHSAAQTQRLGMRLGELLRGGELILLAGQLGTGKTTFTQGLAQGLGISAVVSSPTFTLLKEYRGQLGGRGEGQATRTRGLALYHFDLYRLEHPEEILDLGFEDYFAHPAGVCVVEWADKAAALWSGEYLRVRLKLLSETKRALFFEAIGSYYCDLLQQFQKNTYAALGN